MTGSYRTYYVNQKTGRDSNDGLTMDSPFASLFQVNRLRLYPGGIPFLQISFCR